MPRDACKATTRYVSLADQFDCKVNWRLSDLSCGACRVLTKVPRIAYSRHTDQLTATLLLLILLQTMLNLPARLRASSRALTSWDPSEACDATAYQVRNFVGARSGWQPLRYATQDMQEGRHNARLASIQLGLWSSEPPQAAARPSEADRPQREEHSRRPSLVLITCVCISQAASKLCR